MVGNDRIVLDICGNRYRLVVQFHDVAQVARIRFSGAHAEYDGIDATTVRTMEVRPIRTPEDHEAALARIGESMDAGEGTPAVAEFEVLAILVERYEQESFSIDPPSALDAILFRMEQAGYRQRDLAEVLGSRSRASEIMRGLAKRLSVTQIRRLHAAWKIPADILIRDVA